MGAWRWLLLISLVGTGLLGCAVHPSRKWARWIAPGLGLLVLLALPASADCVRLGQVNMFLALLLTVAMLACARGWESAGAGALALGAGVKLVPGLLVLPLVAARRWRAVAVAASVGLAILVSTAAQLPIERIVHGIVDTARFQSGIYPDWAALHAKPYRWLAFVAQLRHGPLLLFTLAAGLAAVAIHPRRRVVVAVFAMLSAWLGCTASAFHVLYSPLFYPALLYLVAWPLERDAPLGRAVPTSLGALAVMGLAVGCEDLGLVLEARMTLAGAALWALCGIRLLDAWRRSGPAAAPIARRLAGWLPVGLGLLAGLLVARALPGKGPMGPVVPLALQDEAPAGFILEGDDVPGAGVAVDSVDATNEPRRTGRWPRVAVGSTLVPGTHGAMKRHLASAPNLWRSLEAHPEVGPWASWVLEAEPQGALHEQLAADLLCFLARESTALEAHPDLVALEALRVSHAEAMQGAEPQRERRSLGGGGR